MLANAEGNVVSHAQVREQGVVLKHHTDSALLGCQGEAGAGDHLACQADFALVYGFKTGNSAQGSGFATARRAQQTANIAGIEVQVEVLHHALALITTGQITKVKQ